MLVGETFKERILNIKKPLYRHVTQTNDIFRKITNYIRNLKNTVLKAKYIEATLKSDSTNLSQGKCNTKKVTSAKN